MGKTKLQPWWESRSPKYPYQCQTIAGIRPDKIPTDYEPFIAVVLSPGVRTWGFTTEANLEDFKLHYERYLVNVPSLTDATTE